MKPKSMLYSLLVAFLLIMNCSKQNPIAPPQINEFAETQSKMSQITEDEELSSFYWFPGAVTAMTRNIYVGGDVDLVLGATDPTQIPVLVAEIFNQVKSTNFPERAMALAREIAATRPHVVGLQEVSLIRYQSPGDAIGGGAIPAEDVLYDYLKTLIRALKANGAHYKLAGMVQNIDIELPMLVSEDPLQFDDVRLTDFDAIIVRQDVRVSDVITRNYDTKLGPLQNGIMVPRGFVAVTARVGYQAYRVVNTHLEVVWTPEVLPVQMGQAQELLGFLNGEKLPVIMLGDFNSNAPDGETYQLILSQGYTDIWTENFFRYNPDGYTFGHEYHLRNEGADFYKRIDFIFVRNKGQFFPKPVIGLVFAIVVGDEYFNRTTSGLWPSDHGGVVARFRMPTFEQFISAVE